MQLYLAEDPNFNINNPYLYLKNFDSDQEYDAYCDGSFIRIGKDSFCCIGGIILNNQTSEKIGEFFAPINTKDEFNQQIIPNFEKIAINTVFLIKKKYNLKITHIFNDSLSDVSKHNQNVKWIPREKNIADQLVTYAKNKWKEENFNSIENTKFRNNLFKNTYEKDIFITTYTKSSSGLYYFLALDEKKEIIDYIKFNKPNNFGEIELISKILNKNFENINFRINKQLLTILNNYIQGNTFFPKGITTYEDFFNMAKYNNFKFSLKYLNSDFRLKKKDILSYLG